MNLLHIKYAVEVAEAGSINQAAEKLLIGQPSLSRSIKELEASLDVTIFERSSKGMKLTPDGEVFMSYAKNILGQVDAIEEAFKKETVSKKRFSVSVPRASYISKAFVNFSNSLKSESDIEVFYKETNALRAIKNIMEENYKLGIIRYADSYDKYYQEMMSEKGLYHEVITEFHYVLITSRESPLAAKEHITFDDLSDYIEIAHADPFVPTLSLAEVKKKELSDNIRRRIFVFERGSQFELLGNNSDTYMLSSSVPRSTLERYGLIQKECDLNTRKFRDVLIYRKDYTLSELDKLFISELYKTKNEIFE